MSIDEPQTSGAPAVEDEQTEITDPDDIDALLESMGTDDAVTAKASEPKDIETLQEPTEVEELDNAQAPKGENSGNKEKIENLTEEYVAPLLAIDFSDIINRASDHDSTADEEGVAEDEISEEDFDIDVLIAETADENAKESSAQDDPLDEEMIAELLNENATDKTIELTPDFSDKNVLADLLNENDEDSEGSVSEATEINDIQELDNLEFDELLANIEEESSVVNQENDFNQNDFEPPISLDDFDDPNSAFIDKNASNSNEDEKDFVSVDSLLLETEEEQVLDEPYKEANIDVGLNEYTEFTNDVQKVDVDDDENGMAAKLDLAKVYVEIGDQDNAEVILQEIIKQGNNQQKLEAQELLDNL